MNIERRIAALESSASDTGLKIIVVEDGETEAEALERLRLPSDSRVVFGAPLDEKL